MYNNHSCVDNYVVFNNDTFAFQLMMSLDFKVRGADSIDNNNCKSEESVIIISTTTAVTLILMMMQSFGQQQ